VRVKVSDTDDAGFHAGTYTRHSRHDGNAQQTSYERFVTRCVTRSFIGMERRARCSETVRISSRRSITTPEILYGFASGRRITQIRSTTRNNGSDTCLFARDIRYVRMTDSDRSFAGNKKKDAAKAF